MESLSLPLYLFMAAVLIVVAWVRPAYMIGAVICLFGFEQWGSATHTFFVTNQSFVNLLFGGCMVLANLSMALKKGMPVLDFSKAGWILIALYFYTITSTAWSPFEYKGLELWLFAAPYLITFVILSPLLMRSLTDIHDAMSFLVLFGAVVVVMVLFFCEWQGRGLVILGEVNDYGTQEFANPLAISQMAGHIAIAAVFTKQWSSIFWHKLKWVLFVFCVLVIIKSGSRGQLIFLFAAVFLLWPLNNKITSINGFFTLGLSIVLSSYAVEWGLEEYGSDRWGDEEVSEGVGGRYDAIFAVIGHWWSQGPLTLMIGLGNTASYDTNINPGGIYPHNVPLEMLGEEGVIGFLAYSAILVIIVRNIIHIYPFIKDYPRIQGTFVTLCAMLLYEFTLSLKQGNFAGLTAYPMIVIILGKYIDMLAKQISWTRENERDLVQNKFEY